MTTEQDDFWGDQADWPTAAVPIVGHDSPSADPPRDDLPPVEPPPVDLPPVETSPIGASDDTPVAPVWDDRWSPAEPVRARGVDQRLFRLGALAVIITLIVPVVVGFRSGDADDLVTLATAESAAGSETIEDLAATVSTELDASPTVADAAAASAPAEPAATAAESSPAAAAEENSANGASASVETTGSTDDAGSTGAPSEETVSAVAEDQLCAIDYEVRSGDFWLRLADGAGVDLDELLDANAASTDTPLYPGRSICLPAGSQTPPPPPAAGSGSGSGSSAGSSGGSSASTSGGGSAASQPTPTAAPKPASTSPPTTAAPTTTAPPPPPPPPPPPAPAQVEQIIRDVWPDELEDHALEIAWRESNYKANVKNYCCYGLFQIYWTVHRGWLQEMGIGSSEQLFDAETNTRAAYALYQRAGGWGPWGG